MKKKMIIIAMLLATTFFWLPSDSNNVSAQPGQDKHHTKKSRENERADWQPAKHPGIWRKKNAHGYRNYGQYRRTQVGNRRFRMVKRYYTNDGIRLSRLVRVSY
ncbi:MAG: hypothetical protein ABIP78_11330 [Pyrinomonadaceae bacterium]